MGKDDNAGVMTLTTAQLSFTTFKFSAFEPLGHLLQVATQYDQNSGSRRGPWRVLDFTGKQP